MTDFIIKKIPYDVAANAGFARAKKLAAGSNWTKVSCIWEAPA